MLLQLLICLSWLTVTSAVATGCQKKCGDFNIPYPFGIGEQNCYKPGLDYLFCNESFSPPRLLLGNIPVVDISLINGSMTVNLPVFSSCYNKAGDRSDNIEWGLGLPELFTVSYTRNKFTAIGCDTSAIMSYLFSNKTFGGCISVCGTPNEEVDGSCSGSGCCQKSIPKAETAGALAYLHSAASTPIIHRDVKSANILLDDNFTAKVADFGASRLVPIDRTQITTLVQGTLGYLDPEYFHTSRLTQKSDVYSFGVVLVELLTEEKPLSFQRSQDDINLATYFTVSLKENRLFQLVKPQIINEGKSEQIIAYSELAKRCLNLNGEKRPTMKEVAMELEGLRKFEKSISLLSEPEDINSIELSSYTGDTSGKYSME
ncbi:hypothetical protein GIB67_033788 [Kingdonia uniflora]|uniref:Protein kinase domain-containing protein n=1 Tax=Kingdonia uniflora TaxID=39325 RepID=A0A7J7P481_9MAGN|nr:hypothetical protein GIB67_033788 [Kingdonia uniflora]